jgi:hypothetical protein
MRIIILLSFIFFLADCEAQNSFITTDYNNCTQGVKDSSGNWIVQPIYDYIESAFQGTYIVTAGGKQGVIGSNGRIFVPLIYKSVYTDDRHDKDWFGWSTGSNASYFFVAILDHKKGVVDTTGKIILPFVFKSIIIYGSENIIATKNKKNWSFYTSTGEESPIHGHLYDAPSYIDTNLYKVTREIFKLDLHNYNVWDFARQEREGMIDGKGNVILPARFNNIFYEKDSFKLLVAQKNSKVGYFSTAGKVLIPMRSKNYFDAKSRYSDIYRWNSFPTARVGYLPLEAKNKKWGILSLTGDTPLPFVYNNITTLQTPYNFFNKNQSVFLVTKDSLQGCFSPQHGWLLPLQYEDLNSIYELEFPGDTSETRIMAAKKSGKWGIITTDGDCIFPFQYDSIYYVYSYHYLLTEGNKDPLLIGFVEKSGTDFRYDSTALPTDRTNHQLKMVATENGCSYYSIPSITLHPYRGWTDESKAKTDSIIKSDPRVKKIIMISYPITNFITLSDSGELCESKPISLYTFHSTESSLFYRKKKNDNQKITYQLIYTSFSNDENDYLITNKNTIIVNQKIAFQTEHQINLLESCKSDEGKLFFKGHYYGEGIIDSTGKTFIPFSFHNIANFNSDYAWVAGKNKNGFRSKYISYNWNLYCISQKQIILPANYYSQRSAEISNGYTMVTTSKGSGLYDLTNRKFTIAPHYDVLLRLDKAGNYYAVRTCSGSIGIFSKEGVMISDTLWKAITSCNLSEENNKRIFPGYYDFIVFYNSNTHIVFETVTGKFLPDSSIQHLLFRTALVPKSSSQPEVYGTYNEFSPYLKTDSSIYLPVNYKAWQEKVLFDSLYMPVLYTSDSYQGYANSACYYCSSHSYYRSNYYRWSRDECYYDKYYSITYINDSVLSMKRLVDTHYDSNVEDLFITTFCFADGPHPMFLDSLLTGDWKNFVTNEVMNYVSTHLNITGDCHNPAAIPGFLNTQFLLTQNGILLYPPFREHYQQLVLLISWEKLKPYLRKDVASKLGVK